jgi:hypothetical protein
VVQEFFICGPLPGLNELMWKNWRSTGKLKKRWQEHVRMAALVARLKPFGRARFKYTWYEDDQRRDPSNIASGGRKCIEDALGPVRVKGKVVKNGWMKGDGWKWVAGFSDEFVIVSEPGDRAGVLVQITEEP